MKKLLILLAVCTWEYAAAQNQNQSSNTTTAQTTARADTSVSHFLIKAAVTDMMEIKAGETAKQKALNPQVKSYAEMMVRDHTKSSSEVKDLASRKNVQLPASATSMPGSASLGTGASTSRSMGAYGKNTDWGDAVMRHDPGTPETWRSYNSKNTTRSTGGTATYWTPSDKGQIGISNRSAGTSYGTPSRNTMGATGRNANADASHADISGTNTVDRTSVSGNINTDGEVPTDLDADIQGTVSDNRSSLDGDVRTDASASANLNGGNTDTRTSVNGNASIDASTSDNMTGEISGNAETRRSVSGTDANNSSASAGASSDITMGASGQTMTHSSADLAGHQAKLNSLMQKSGAEFDREYMDMMANDHMKAIQLYERASGSSDADIRAFADRMLPILRQHQNSAKTILNSLKNDNSSL